MPRDGTHGLIRCSAFQQFGDGLMAKTLGRQPWQAAQSGNGPESSANEAGACRAVGIIHALFHPEWNEVVLRFERTALLCLCHEIANCRKCNIIQRHTPY